jgi:hypothetical protein
MADTPTARLNAHVADVYAAQKGAGSAFTIDDITAAAIASVPPQDTEALVHAAVKAAVRRIDDRQTARPPQATLWDDLDRVLVIGPGLRRRKGSCNADNMAAHIEIVTTNRDAVVAAADVEIAEYRDLVPHLVAGLTVDQAAAAIVQGNVG